MITDAEIRERLRGHEIAGGKGYRPEIHPSDADVTVSTRRELESALGSSRDIIGIDGDARIDLSGLSFSTRKTLVSDRGIGGSEGALLFTTDHGESSPAWDGGPSRGVITLRGGGTLAGLRVRGPYHDYYDDPRYPGFIPLDSGNASERRRKRQARYARGVRVLSDDGRVSNCKLWGWPNQAISVGTASAAYSPLFDHLDVHDCMMTAYGYGIDIFRGEPEISTSYFNATRHSIDGFGYTDCGYTLTDSVFGPITSSHAVDMHSLGDNGYDSTDRDDRYYRLRAGSQITVQRCSFLFREDIGGSDEEAIVIRGEPDRGVSIEDCRFLHERAPTTNSENSSRGDAWRQPNVQTDSAIPRRPDGFTTNWSTSGNEFEPAPINTDAGAPVRLFEPDEEPRGMPKERGRSLCEIFG